MLRVTWVMQEQMGKGWVLWGLRVYIAYEISVALEHGTELDFCKHYKKHHKQIAIESTPTLQALHEFLPQHGHLRLATGPHGVHLCILTFKLSLASMNIKQNS